MSALGRITQGSHITYYYFVFFIAYTFKGRVHVFAGQVKIVGHSCCRTSAILKYFVPGDCNVYSLDHQILVLIAYITYIHNVYIKKMFVCLVWFFTYQSTAMVMSRRSVHLTTLSPGQA